MIRKILIGFIVLVVAFLGVGFILPGQSSLSRSIDIAAPPSTIFALVNGFRSFDKWSPWLQKDPNAKVEMAGPPLGVGAKYSWSGNKDVGTGSQEIVESTPYSQVKTKLFFGGFDRPSFAAMTLVPDGQATKVTWSLDSDFGSNPVWHYFGLMMDKMVGPDYELGLARLKTLAESMPNTDFSSLNVKLIDSRPAAIVYVPGTTSTDVAVIGPALAMEYGKLGAFMKTTGLKMTGAPLAVTRRYDDQSKVYEFDAGVPVDRDDVTVPDGSEVKLGKLYAGEALQVTHIGPYSALPKTYGLIEAYKKAYALQDNGNTWEQYVDDPTQVPEAELKTIVMVPIK